MWKENIFSFIVFVFMDYANPTERVDDQTHSLYTIPYMYRQN